MQGSKRFLGFKLRPIRRISSVNLSPGRTSVVATNSKKKKENISQLQVAGQSSYYRKARGELYLAENHGVSQALWAADSIHHSHFPASHCPPFGGPMAMPPANTAAIFLCLPV